MKEKVDDGTSTGCDFQSNLLDGPPGYRSGSPDGQSNGSDCGAKSKIDGCLKLIVQGGTLSVENDLLCTQCNKLQE